MASRCVLCRCARPGSEHAGVVVAPTGSARLRFATSFYLVVLFFVIFSLEAVFLFVWAIAARAPGWSGYIGMVIFMGVLTQAT